MIHVPFTKEEIAKFPGWSIQRNDSHLPRHDRRVDQRRSSIGINLSGVESEYSVFAYTGGIWHRFLETKKDPGWEIVRPDGIRVQVKSTNHPNGRFALKRHEPFVADFGVLVYTGDTPRSATIRGYISRDDYHRFAVLTDLGYKDAPMWVVASRHLPPAEEFLGTTRIPLETLCPEYAIV